ncbi:MAG TPA: 3-carboxy-cis,cis-muconate cycloisomerase [Xanthobacteraceae bacterium]
MSTPLLSSLYAPLLSSTAMRAILDDRSRLQRMLDFEAALARAEATLGIIPQAAAGPIAAACEAALFDLVALAEASVPAGNIAIPLVKALTAQVQKHDPEAARYVHWGVTSQDVIDTALVLELRLAIDALLADLNRAVAGFTRLAERYRTTPCVGRTWLQQALPIPFGLKVAGYAAALARSRERLKRLREEALVLQLGGAAGTLAALGDRGLALTEELGRELALPCADAPWHSHRDRLAGIASEFAILGASCGKIARDVTLLMQTEVGEAFEQAVPGRGGSSTMPHKRNPTASVAALSAAMIAPNLAATIIAAGMHEHERATGGWQAEWPTFPALALVISGALHNIVDIAEGLEVDPDHMQQNLEATRGLIMAEAVSFGLAVKLGKSEAHKLVEEASRKAVSEKRHLQAVLAEDKRVSDQLTERELADLFDPLKYQGVAQSFIDRLLSSARSETE